MKTPDLSFVVPVRNGEEFIAEALSSCMAQTYKNIQVVAVDDGSTDATPKLLRWFADKDQRVKVITLSGKGNRGAARNVGCYEADAKTIAVLDADDMAARNRAEETLRALKGQPDAYLFGGASMVDATSIEVGQTLPIPFDLDRSIKEGINGIVHSTAAYSKKLWSSFNYDEGEYAELGLDDWLHQIRIGLKKHPFISVQKILSAYRLNDMGVSKLRDHEKVVALKRRFFSEQGIGQKEDAKAEAAA